MLTVTATQFRNNQAKILSAAKEGIPVVMTSRFGDFKLLPCNNAAKKIGKELREAMAQVKADLAGEISLPNAEDIVF